MKQILVLCVIVVGGCVTLEPWKEYLDARFPEWRRYLDQRISCNFNNQPVDEVLADPLFEFKGMPQVVKQPVSLSQLDFYGPLVHERLLTLRATRATRREILWRIAQQCDLDMNVEWDHDSIEPVAVAIEPKKKVQNNRIEHDSSRAAADGVLPGTVHP